MSSSTCNGSRFVPDSAATALKTNGVVGDVPRSHDAAFASLRDGAGCDFLFRVSASVLVDDHGAVDDGFGSDSVGLERLLVKIEEWTSCCGHSNHDGG